MRSALCEGCQDKEIAQAIDCGAAESKAKAEGRSYECHCPAIVCKHGTDSDELALLREVAEAAEDIHPAHGYARLYDAVEAWLAYRGAP